MCGIVGIIGDTRSVPLASFLEMRDSLAYRGPDDAGVWEARSGHALLGCRRLAILDLSPSGHQPMQDGTGDVAIAFNGEIYNYLELREELAHIGYRFRSHTDTEVLLRAYEAWGKDCLLRLNGMFAFAIWDDRRQELFAARDRFGEKPFYYFQDDDRELFAFASEIKALVAARLFEPRPDPAAIYRYLRWMEIDDGADTLFADVAALPAAHALLLSGRRRMVKVWRYWDLDGKQENLLPADRDYAERFLTLLADSVRLRLRSDVPVGSSLSGGLDSSTIVGLIARSEPTARQATFSARFHDPRLDEGQYIEKITACYDLERHEVYPDPAALPEEIETLTWHQDHPFESTSIFAQWSVMRLARQCGVTVLLDGQGGDETLAGYHLYFGSYFKQVPLPDQVPWLFRYIREHGTGALPSMLSSVLPARLREASRKLVSPQAISPEFEMQFGSEPSRLPAKFRDGVHDSLYNTLTHTVLPRLLRYADRNSMAFSREVRLPFLDHRLVEFLFSIPADQKIRGTTTKVILRHAARGLLPEEIRNRKDKLGYAPPEATWLRGLLRPWVEELFRSAEFRERGWLDPQIVQSAWRAFLGGRDRYLHHLWRWISLELWARSCLTARQLQVCKPTSIPAATHAK